MALWLQQGSSCIVFQSLPILKKYLNSLLMILLLHFHKSLLREKEKGRHVPHTRLGKLFATIKQGGKHFPCHVFSCFTFFKPIIRVCSNTSLAALATLSYSLSLSLAAMKPSCGKTLNYFRRAAHKSVKCPATPTPGEGKQARLGS